ncbi:MAG: carboxypeptidase regulatory-like domain-containing protein [Acidobacteriota bacterium]
MRPRLSLIVAAVALLSAASAAAQTNVPSMADICRADLSKNRIVDQADVDIVRAAYRTKLGQAKFNPAADFNGDNVISLYDLTFVTSKVGLACVAPAVAVSSPTAGLITRLALQTVSGTVSDLAVTSASLNHNGALQKVVVAGGQFAHQLTLAEGLNRVSVAATGAGGTGTSAELQLTLDSLPPAIAATVPRTARPGATVPVSAVANDLGGLDGVTFSLDGAPVGQLPAAPFLFSFDVPLNAIVGTIHTVAVEARDRAGNTTTSRHAVVVEGVPDTLPPSVIIQAPTEAAPGEQLPIVTSAQDDGQLVRLTLERSGLVLQTVVGAPFTTQYAFTVPTGALEGDTIDFVAQAVDGAGNVSVAGATVTVVSQTTDVQQLRLAVNPPFSPTFLPSQVVGGAVGSDVAPVVRTPQPFVASLGTTEGRQGEQLSVVVQGVNTNFQTGLSQAAFGGGITVQSVIANSATELQVDISIAQTAGVGPRLVSVSTGTEEAFLANAFNVRPGVGTLGGRLVDEAGNAIANAQVCVPGAAICVLSDATGAFVLAGVPTTTMRFVVSAAGFDDRTLQFALQIGQNIGLGSIALAPASFPPPPPPPSGAPTITAALAAAFGRGATVVQEGGDPEKLRKLVVDTIVAVGGTELGALDANGQQLNPLMTGPGAASLLDHGARDIAHALSGAEYTTLGELLLACILSFEYGANVPVPALGAVLAAFQGEVNAAWATPGAVSSPLLMALTNHGRTVSLRPPQLTLDTPLNPLQSYLLATTWFAFVSRHLPVVVPPTQARIDPHPAAPAPPATGLFARLAHGVRGVAAWVTSGRVPMSVRTSRAPTVARGGLSGKASLGRLARLAERGASPSAASIAIAQQPPAGQWPSLMWETIIANSSNTLPSHIQNQGAKLCESVVGKPASGPLLKQPGCSEAVKLIELLVSTQADAATQTSASFTKFFTDQASPASAQRIQQQFSSQSYQNAWKAARDEAKNLAKAQAFAKLSSNVMQGILAKQIGDVTNLIFGLEAELIIESLKPQPPVITNVTQATDAQTGLPLPKVLVEFQRSVNDRGSQASAEETWYYELWRAGAGLGQQRVNVSRFPTQGDSRTLTFDDEPVPEGGWSYQVVAVRLVGKIALDDEPNAIDAIYQAVAGLGVVPSANFTTPGSTFQVPGNRTVSIGGVGTGALQTVLNPVAVIFKGVRNQRSLMSDAQAIYVSARPPAARPPASLAVDWSGNSVFLSIPVTRNIFRINSGNVFSFADTNFAFPNQVGLAIDSRGSLYADNAASDAKFGGRLFRFQQPDGRRDLVGSVNYYSFLLQYARPTSPTSLAVGPAPFGEALYIADALDNAVKRIFLPHTYPPGVTGDRNVGQIFVQSDQFTFGPTTTMAFRGDGSLFLNQGADIFRVPPAGGSFERLFDPQGAPSRFFQIGGLTFDVFSNLYVADQALGTITMIPMINIGNGLTLGNVSNVDFKKLTVTRGLRKPGELKLAPDDRGLVFFDQERAVVVLPFGVSGQIVDANGQPLPTAEVLARDRGKATVTDADGVFVLPGLLGAGASSVVDLTVRSGGRTQTFRAVLDPRQHNIADFVFDPPPPPPPVPGPVPPPPPPPPVPPLELDVETETTPIPQLLTPLRFAVPPVPPPLPPPGPQCPRAFFFEPGHRTATIASPIRTSGGVTDPSLTAGFVIVNGVSQAAAVVNEQFLELVILRPGDNLLSFALSGAVLKSFGCVDPSTPDNAVIPISSSVNVFHDTSPDVLRAVRQQRGFDAAVVGRAIDPATNSAVAGLTVEVPGTDLRTETDGDGVFQINLPLGGVNFSREVSQGSQVSLTPFEGLAVEQLGNVGGGLSGLFGSLSGQMANILKQLRADGLLSADVLAQALNPPELTAALSGLQDMFGTLSGVAAQNPPPTLQVDVTALERMRQVFQARLSANQDPPRAEEAELQDHLLALQQRQLQLFQVMKATMECMQQSIRGVIQNLQGDSGPVSLGLFASRLPLGEALLRNPSMLGRASLSAAQFGNPCTTRADLIASAGQYLVQDADLRQQITSGGGFLSSVFARALDIKKGVLGGLLATLQVGADPTPTDEAEVSGFVEHNNQWSPGGSVGGLLGRLNLPAALAPILSGHLDRQELQMDGLLGLVKKAFGQAPPSMLTPDVSLKFGDLSGAAATILARLQAKQDKTQQDVDTIRDLSDRLQTLLTEINRIMVTARETQTQIVLTIK